MYVFNKLVQRLKHEPESPSPVFPETSKLPSSPIAPEIRTENFELLRSLRLIHRSYAEHSYSLKVFQGRLSFDGRVVCGRCVSRRCFDSSRLVVAKKDVSLFGCDGCHDFLIRMSGQA